MLLSPLRIVELLLQAQAVFVVVVLPGSCSFSELRCYCFWVTEIMLLLSITNSHSFDIAAV